MFPNDGWKTDQEFQNDCLAYTLFHGQNRISSRFGVNNWIPFTENEVNSRDKFESNFMTQLVSGKLSTNSPFSKGCHEVVGYSSVTNSEKTPRQSVTATPLGEGNSEELFATNQPSFVPTKPLEFSPQSRAVFEAGLELWKYYHKTSNLLAKVDPVASLQTSCVANKSLEGVMYNQNAAFYDIKEHFQGRNEIGRMNNKSEDLEYVRLISNLRQKMEILESKIQPKVCEYGFLLG